jgi:hypothetical protein
MNRTHTELIRGGSGFAPISQRELIQQKALRIVELDERAKAHEAMFGKK